tara:strand:+ start:320 stop:553 length:234 start_codon:yes stop_codon:yes gene_type:complete
VREGKYDHMLEGESVAIGKAVGLVLRFFEEMVNLGEENWGKGRRETYRGISSWLLVVEISNKGTLAGLLTGTENAGG